MSDTPTFELHTFGHATLVVTRDGQSLIATDPWLVGSAYWRSWWLEAYPTDDQVAQVTASQNIYVTHSHPDHLHLPSLRTIGSPPTLHPTFANYLVPDQLRSMGLAADVLAPGQWYQVAPDVRAVSIPTAPDDSILIIDTPCAIIVDVNDCVPSRQFLKTIRKYYIRAGAPVVLLRSHSPASIGAAIFANGVRTPLSDSTDYVSRCINTALALDASALVSFGSQATFERADSAWANDYRVTWQALVKEAAGHGIVIHEPHIRMNLHTLESCAHEESRVGHDDRSRIAKIAAREREEASFAASDELLEQLAKYLRPIPLLSWIARDGIDWQLTSSGRIWRYDTRRRVVQGHFDELMKPSFAVRLPDLVLFEALNHSNLGDVANSMFCRVETSVGVKRPYVFFALVAAKDAGHFDSLRNFARFCVHASRGLLPRLWSPWWRSRSRRAQQAIPNS